MFSGKGDASYHLNYVDNNLSPIFSYIYIGYIGKKSNFRVSCYP